jgi:flagellar biosynthetic protein FliQ
MPDDAFVEVLRKMLFISIELSVPVLGAALVVGLLIGIMQAITSIQEQTLAFVPKLFAIVMVFAVGGHWMMRLIVDYTGELFANLPKYGLL